MCRAPRPDGTPRGPCGRGFATAGGGPAGTDRGPGPGRRRARRGERVPGRAREGADPPLREARAVPWCGANCGLQADVRIDARMCTAIVRRKARSGMPVRDVPLLWAPRVIRWLSREGLRGVTKRDLARVRQCE